MSLCLVNKRKKLKKNHLKNIQLNSLQIVELISDEMEKREQTNEIMCHLFKKIHNHKQTLQQKLN